MKFRSKKTGEKYEAISHEPIDIFFYNPAGRDGLTKRSYDSLAELNEEWEDYEPAEPLIKDEKIRKVVRAWAEINSIEKISYAARLYGSSCMLTDMDDDHFSIEFVGWIPTLKDQFYTIAELCGEEDE